MDLQSIETKLRKQLEAIDQKKAAIEEKLKALDVVKQAAVEAEDINASPAGNAGSVQVAGPENTNRALEESPATHEAEEVAEAAQEAAAEEVQEEQEKEEVKEETVWPVEPSAELETLAAEPAPSEDMVALTEEDAIIEVIRTFNEPLKGPRIAEELIAVGYPFDDGDPGQQVAKTLDKMLKEGRIKKMKTIRGTFFGLPDY